MQNLWDKLWRKGRRRLESHIKQARLYVISAYRRIDHTKCNNTIITQQNTINSLSRNLTQAIIYKQQAEISAIEKQRKVYELEMAAKLPWKWGQELIEEGWYWWKIKNGATVRGPVLVNKSDDGILIFGDSDLLWSVAESNRMWAGPLPEPE